LFTSGAFTPIDFAHTQTGAGNAGYVFGLDSAQQAAAAAAFSGSFANNVVGLSATVGCNNSSGPTCLGATGGFETFFVASAAGPVQAVPEPGTFAMLLAGLGVIAFMSRRGRTS
ncbi:PEP-CTERM sorting domain-containing protein, partial [Ideonella sp.]|uniref:PEP-CTERM sorting domain-containing protein n=1 Tax=Ideonella sp. TaxID=1929293 RepID=UPI002B469E4D